MKNQDVKKATEAPDGHIWIARGPHCWGRSKVASVAVAYAKENMPSRTKVKEWDCKLFPEDSQVSEFDGSVAYPSHGCGIAECIGRDEA